jgi:hypothetical protein
MKELLALGIILFAIALVVIGPYCTIWSLNVLFPSLNIPFTFETWCAVVILGLVARGPFAEISKKD